MGNEEMNIKEEMDCKRVFIRKHIQAPDTDKAWKAFYMQSMQTTPTHAKTNISHKKGLIIGFISIAAAIFAGLFLMRPKVAEYNQQTKQIFVAKSQTYNNATLTSKSGIVPLIGKQADSLIYSKVSTSAAVPQSMTLSIPRGKSYFLLLPDGTKAWLNADSRLIFPEHFSGNYRFVELIGEAYFEVTKDKDHPFIVNSAEFTTQVLGTKFDIRAYPNSEPDVVLMEGKVALKSKKSNATQTILPGEKAQIKGNGSFDVAHNVDMFSCIQWKDGYFYFNDSKLGDILQELGRWYNVDITMENPQKSNIRMHFVADRDQSITAALENLNAIGDVNASFINNKVIVK